MQSYKYYIASFAQKLSEVNIHELEMAAYPKKYLELLLQHKTYYLHIYAHVLDRLTANTNVAKERLVLVDYGAGNGMLGLFAKYCGFGRVYLNDVSGPFLEAAVQLSKQLGIEADGYIEGDIDTVRKLFKEQHMPNAIIGTDVIEHIYNLNHFFTTIAGINPKMVTVFTTASVTSNPIKTKQLKQLQHKDELVESNAEHAIPGDEFAGMPFIKIRGRIIKQHAPKLSRQTIDKLASATRGMNKQDILVSVNRFIEHGKMPVPPTHVTNTCDPITGSWTERLLTTKEYERIYNSAGFSLMVYNGFYNQWQGGLKSLALNLLNKIIALPAGQGRLITPFITLVGRQK